MIDKTGCIYTLYNACDIRPGVITIAVLYELLPTGKQNYGRAVPGQLPRALPCGCNG